MSIPLTPNNPYISAPMTPSTPGNLFYQQINVFSQPLAIPSQQPVSLDPVPLSPRSSSFTDAPQQQQSSQSSDPSTMILMQLTNALTAQADFLHKMRYFQRQVLQNPQRQNFDILTQQHEQMKKQLDAELKTLCDMENQIILSPPEIQKLTQVKQKLITQTMQLELYHQELQGLLAQQSGGPQRW